MTMIRIASHPFLVVAGGGAGAIGSIVSVLGLALTIGCAERSTRGQDLGAPRPVVAFETTVAEGDSVLLSLPGFLAIAPSGDFVVTDAVLQRVVVVSREGHVLKRFGRQGRGPGEALALGFVFFVDDTTLATIDHNVANLTLWAWPEGVYRSSREIPGFGFYGAVKEGRTIWLGWMGPRSGIPQRAIGKWDLNADSIDFVAKAPSEYFVHPASPLLVFASVRIDVWVDTIDAVFGARNRLEQFDTLGMPLRAWELPVSRRRGVPEDIKARMTRPTANAIKKLSYE
ncbi:MAG: hypothetical protein AB7Q69_15365, partial [Gemmatimonadales bacterium]